MKVEELFQVFLRGIDSKVKTQNLKFKSYKTTMASAIKYFFTFKF